MVKVVGFRSVDFEDNNGNRIKGTKLFITDDSNEYVTGVSTDSIFVSENKMSFKPELNMEVDVRYNKYGKIASIQKVGKI